MSETGFLEPRKQRSATASNVEETIFEGIPDGRTNRANSVMHSNDHHGSSRRLSTNPFNWRLRKQRKSQDFSTNSLAVAQKSNTVNIARPIYTQDKFDEGFDERGPEKFDFKAKARKCFTCDCSKACWKDFLYKFFPFIGIMKNYSVREDLQGDIVAGLTVGIMNIPQGMAYALLASMPPIYGLYVSFFPLLTYFFFGGSRHISVGTFAVVSLMVGGAVESQMDGCMKAMGDSTSSSTLLNTTSTTTPSSFSSGYNLSSTTATLLNLSAYSENSTVTESSTEMDAKLTCRIGIATTLTIMVGLCQILMGVLRLGFVTIYLADPLISGFTTGAACHVFTSQVKYVLGVKVERYNGALKLIKTYINLFSNIATINWAELITAAICIITLVLVKECINDRFKSKMKMPVPIDLIVVVLGTLISYFARLHENFSVTILGDIPVGFPSPKVPPIGDMNISGLLPNAFTIAVVAFAVSVSMSKIFAKKHNYEIDSDQELLAHGISNVFGSFFSCFTSCASLSRSAVQDNQGGKTQIAGLISCSMILVVLVAIGPYFKTLPNAVLAAIILVALKGMFKQFLELKRLWSISYYDFSIWLVTWLAVVVLDVDLGLAVGVIFGLLTVVFRTQYPNTVILARVPHTDLYKDKGIYPTVQEVPHIKIFRIDASLYYANVEHFRQKLYKLTEVNPRVIKLARAKLESKVEKEIKAQKKQQSLRRRKAAKLNGDVENEVTGYIEIWVTGTDQPQRAPSLENQMDLVGRDEEETVDILPANKRAGWPKPEVNHIIIDCSMMSYVDSVGVGILRSVYQEYKDVNIDVFLVNCKAAVRDMFTRCDFYEKVPKDSLYLTIHDGVIAALSKKHKLLDEPVIDFANPLAKEVNRDTKIVSRPNSIYGGSDSRSRTSSLANIFLNRRPSQTGPLKPRGSIVPNLPPQGEDSELVESEDDEKIAEDPVNGEVNTNGNLLHPQTDNISKRKQSCHM